MTEVPAPDASDPLVVLRHQAAPWVCHVRLGSSVPGFPPISGVHTMWFVRFLFWPYYLMKWLLTPRVEAAVRVAAGREKVDETIDKIISIEGLLRRFGLDYIGLAGGGVLSLAPLLWHIATRTLSDADFGAFLAKYAWGTVFAVIGVVITSVLLLVKCRQDRAWMVRGMRRGPWLAVAIWFAGFGLPLPELRRQAGGRATRGISGFPPRQPAPASP